MQRNETILKLGFECDDAHWRNLIDRALLRNNDYWRRRQSSPLIEELGPVEERSLGNIILTMPPDGCPTETFHDDNLHHGVLRSCMLQNRKLPTTSQLQSCAKNSGKPLPYNKAAPLIRECRIALLRTSVGKEVVIADAFGTELSGILRTWSENNDKWSLDILTDCNQRISFRSNSEPSFSVSKAYADWLRGGNAQVGGG
uniref:Uncharacterized protein n=1 Tax=Alexandrium andersonii TaxID=327968 RepID=A0A7S2DZ56_9DINO|mmetsp:Transcript_62031/g.139688  ORF Transcript_62031/g.139688 Transcript_62031/m.139688 type:complete len:200 (+) Transcript_62031:3-602(+)